jgi:hypothetical protein
LTMHCVEQHGYRGFMRVDEGQHMSLEPLWVIGDQATKNMVETVSIQATNFGRTTLNKEPGPAVTGLTNAIARSFPQSYAYSEDGGAIPPLSAAPTSTRNCISSCQGAILSRRASIPDDFNSSNQALIPRHGFSANSLPGSQESQPRRLATAGMSIGTFLDGGGELAT